MLYRTLKRMIERGQTAGMEEKLDIFYAAGKITEAQYTELLELLNAGGQEGTT
nr:MAG TPA: Short C-terminal domain [Caudoviricetes sp.]